MSYKALKRISDDNWDSQPLLSLLLVSCNAAVLPSQVVSRTASSPPTCNLCQRSELATQVCQRTFTAKQVINVDSKA